MSHDSKNVKRSFLYLCCSGPDNDDGVPKFLKRSTRSKAKPNAHPKPNAASHSERIALA